jgi:hypothetical protein
MVEGEKQNSETTFCSGVRSAISLMGGRGFSQMASNSTCLADPAEQSLAVALNRQKLKTISWISGLTAGTVGRFSGSFIWQP